MPPRDYENKFRSLKQEIKAVKIILEQQVNVGDCLQKAVAKRHKDRISPKVPHIGLSLEMKLARQFLTEVEAKMEAFRDIEDHTNELYQEVFSSPGTLSTAKITHSPTSISASSKTSMTPPYTRSPSSPSFSCPSRLFLASWA
jgi:hypothetical protein